MIWALIFITNGLCFYFKLIFKVNFIVTVIDLINRDKLQVICNHEGKGL